MTFLPMSYLLLMARQPSRKKQKTCLSPSIIQNTHMTSCDWAQWATTLDTWIMYRMIWIRWKIYFVMMHISWILISCWGWVNRKCVENKLQKLQTYTMTSGRESFQCFIYGFSFLLYVDFKQSKYALNLHVPNKSFIWQNKIFRNNIWSRMMLSRTQSNRIMRRKATLMLTL